MSTRLSEPTAIAARETAAAETAGRTGDDERPLLEWTRADIDRSPVFADVRAHDDALLSAWRRQGIDGISSAPGDRRHLTLEPEGFVGSRDLLVRDVADAVLRHWDAAPDSRPQIRFSPLAEVIGLAVDELERYSLWRYPPGESDIYPRVLTFLTRRHTDVGGPARFRRDDLCRMLERVWGEPVSCGWNRAAKATVGRGLKHLLGVLPEAAEVEAYARWTAANGTAGSLERFVSRDHLRKYTAGATGVQKRTRRSRTGRGGCRAEQVFPAAELNTSKEEDR